MVVFGRASIGGKEGGRGERGDWPSGRGARGGKRELDEERDRSDGLAIHFLLR